MVIAVCCLLEDHLKALLLMIVHTLCEEYKEYSRVGPEASSLLASLSGEERCYLCRELWEKSHQWSFSSFILVLCNTNIQQKG